MAKLPTKRPRTDLSESSAGPSRKRLDTKPSSGSKQKGRAVEKIVKTASKVSVKSQVDSDDEESDDESGDEDNLMGDEEVGAMSGESDTDSDDEDDSDDEEDSDDEGSEQEEGSEEDEEDEDIPVSLEDCLERPLYTLQDPESDTEAGFAYQACVLCPSKILKNQTMVDVHLKSSTHGRAKRRMAERLLDPDSITSADPRDIVAEIEEKLAQSRATESTPKHQKPKSNGLEVKEGDDEATAGVGATSGSTKAKKGNRRNKVAQQIEERRARRAAREAEVGK